MKNKIQNITFTALMTALLCIAGPIVVPIGMVPMSFANLAIYLTILLLEKQWATVSVAVYLLIGMVGIPVFAGLSGGAGKLFGPTGGYLIGYLALTWIAGSILEKRKKNFEVLADKWRQITALLAGTLVLYIFGTLWLMYQSKLSFQAALGIGVLPFLPFDVVKVIVAVLLGNAIKVRLKYVI